MDTLALPCLCRATSSSCHLPDVAPVTSGAGLSCRYFRQDSFRREAANLTLPALWLTTRYGIRARWLRKQKRLGIRAHVAGQEPCELSALQERAYGGDAQAQYELGQRMRYGEGVTMDKDVALELIESAARAGILPAKVAAASMLLAGEGCTPDEEDAASWLFEAAEAGDADSQLQLARMLYGESSLDIDMQGSLFWLKKAADQGHPEAAFDLANQLLKGVAVQRDDALAARYYHKAAEQGHIESSEALGLMLCNGTGVVADRDEAVLWLTKAVELGSPNHASLCHTIANAYRTNSADGGKRDAALTAQWLRRAAQHGHAKSAEELAIMCLTGDGVPLDEEEASYWFEQAEVLSR